MDTFTKPLVPIQPTPDSDSQSPQVQAVSQLRSSGHTVGQHSRQKLRLTCDACLAAKVKCGKESPRCKRCNLHGLTCLYGPSLKYGKPEKGRKILEHQSTARRLKANNLPPQPKPPATIGDHDYYQDLHQSFLDLIHSVSDNAELASSPQASPSDSSVFPETVYPATPFSPFEDTLIGDRDSASNTSSMAMGSLGLSNCISSQNFFDPFAASVSWSSSPASSHPTNVESSSKPKRTPSSSISLPEVQPNGSFSRSKSHTGIHDCWAIAESTITSLQSRSQPLYRVESDEILTPSFSPVSLFASSHPPIQTLEDLLRINQEAISNTSQSLNCPCARDPHMAMLYASIIVKVLYWYQAVADSKSSHPSASAHADPTANVVPLAGLLAESALSETQAEQPPGPCDASFVALEPFRIGTFMPDQEDQEHMRRLLLLSNLKKVGRLIEALVRIGDTVDEGASKLYRTLGAWLRSELSRIIQKG